jgi:sugar transferase EpsL
MTGRAGFYRRYAKRGLDLAVAVPALVATAPVLGATAVAVRVLLGTPVLFQQPRPGQDGKPFLLLKFRTMTDDRDRDGNLLPDAQRLTPFGKWLRSTSLDELPTLINVVRGDMSLIGPRPLLMDYLPLYSPEQARRHEVKPGITGLAQVNGRNAISWEKKFELDVWYVDHLSLRVDLRILAKTMIKVLQRDGISADGSATMPKFTGSNATRNDSQRHPHQVTHLGLATGPAIPSTPHTVPA